MFESKLNGRDIDLKEPFALMRFNEDKIELTMSYDQYIEFMSNTMLNFGYYYNDLYAFAVLYILNTEEVEVVEKHANERITISANIYRQNVIGNAKRVGYTAGTRELKWWEFVVAPNNVAFATGRVLGLISWKSWARASENWTAPWNGWLFTGDEIREVTT